MKLKTADIVIVTSGKDKGKTGKITKVLPKKGKVIVEDINKYKRHLKRQSDKNPGGIVEVERAIWTSNLKLICPTCKKPTRVGYKVTKSNKQRICKKCLAPIEVKK